MIIRFFQVLMLEYKLGHWTHLTSSNRQSLPMPEPISSTLDPRGIGYAYYLLMQKYRNKFAQFDVITNEEQAYGDLLQRCIETALAMENAGLKPGDFISICSGNHLDVCVPYIASLFSGVITASVEPTMSVQEITHLLNQVMPKIIFVGPQAVGIIEEVVEKLETMPLIVVFGENEKHINFSEFLIPSTSREEFTPRKPDDLDETSLVIFSSGTTGKPKGICHTHRSMLSSIEDSALSGFSTIAWFTTPYWITFYAGLHCCIINGMRRLVFPGFDRNNPWQVLKFKIDFLLANGVQAATYLRHPIPDHAKLENLVHLCTGGHPISKEQALEFRRKFPNVQLVNMYGQTELFGGPFLYPLYDERKLIEKYPNLVGIPKPSVAWKIVDIETGKILGPNEQGELRVKASAQCKGYHNCDSSETFDSEGWLRTGDMAYYNEDMCFFITNRIKESFKYHDNHVIPSEIEEVLLSHPSIAKAVVLGVPHETDKNHPMAVIELNEKGADVCEEEIVKYVEIRVDDKNRLRAGVKIVSQIPLTVTDKINRFKLRQMLLSNKVQ